MDLSIAQPQLIKRLASGGEGTVHLARWQDQTIVVKIPHDPNAPSVTKELEIFKQIDHPNLLNLLDVLPEKKWLLFPYMEKGALNRLLFGKAPLPWMERLALASDITKALAYLHGKTSSTAT